MEFIRTLAQIRRQDVAIAGGKGASLGELTHICMPVPPGFVVLVNSYEAFLSDTGIGPRITSTFQSIVHTDLAAVQHASQELQALIIAADPPESLAADIARNFTLLDTQYAAVRSSATSEDSQSASWAGQFETFLNATEATLFASVKQCWASLFSPRAISYRFERGLQTNPISAAVVIQKMVKSDAAGTAFSAHPVMGDDNLAVIEAVYGLGEPMVSGLITPDTYLIDKSAREVVDVQVNEQDSALYCAPNGGTEWTQIDDQQRDRQKLTTDEIINLTDLVVAIERHFAVPIDVEWARENGQLYILQARPITGLKRDSR